MIENPDICTIGETRAFWEVLERSLSDVIGYVKLSTHSDKDIGPLIGHRETIRSLLRMGQ